MRGTGPLPSYRSVTLFTKDGSLDASTTERLLSTTDLVLEGITDAETYGYKILYDILKDCILYRKAIRDGWEFLLKELPKTLRNEVLRESHDSVLHFTTVWHAHFIAPVQRYYWPGLLESVSSYCSSCDSCQRRKDPVNPGGYLQPTTFKGPFIKCHSDHAEPLCMSPIREKN